MHRQLYKAITVKLFLQARFKDKGSEIASEQLSQVFLHSLLSHLHGWNIAAASFSVLDIS